MNRNTHTIDDPKLTAYALGELGAQERAEIERRLADDTEARRQVEETMAFAVRLGSALRTEETTDLRAEQLRAIREAARKDRKVILFPAWLMRVAIPMAAAAGIALAAWFVIPAKDLGQQVAMAPATPQPTAPLLLSVPTMPIARPNETPNATVDSRELTRVPDPGPRAQGTSRRSLLAGDSNRAQARSHDTLSSPAMPESASSDGIAHRGEVTVGLQLQSTGGGALGQQPVQAAQGGGLVAQSQPMATAGDAMMHLGEAERASAGGAFAYGGAAAATAGGGLASPDGSAAGADGALGRQALVGIKNFQKGWTENPVAGRPEVFGKPARATHVAGSYLVDVMPHPVPPDPELPMLGRPAGKFDTETYDKIEDNAFLEAKQNPLSTFSIDVDTGSYANVRRFLRGGQLPPAGAVRIEEMLNYFEYDYPPAPEGKPFSVSVDVVEAPWNTKHQLARIGLKGREIDPAHRPACNLVFLLDVSGSMNEPNKLPLVKQAMKILVEQLGEKDRVAIVTYAGASGLALPSTPADRQRDIREAIDELRPGGSTNGEAGIQLAYDIAKANLIPGGANRVILATDGDFNIGVTSRDELLRLIEEKAKSGVFLTVLGFGMGNIKDATLEQLADKGNGTYGYIDDEREAKRLFARHATGSLVTIAKDVKIQVEFNPARVGAYRLIGYENRALRAEDFNDDKKDAGEIGSGHTVTALYELVPPGEATELPKVDELKYQQPAKSAPAAKGDEMMTVKLRYKKPDGDNSDKIEVPVAGEAKAIAAASADLKFAAAVAEAGMLLRNSPHKGASDWKGALELAAAGRGADAHGDRAEFIDLVRAAEKLSDQR